VRPVRTHLAFARRNWCELLCIFEIHFLVWSLSRLYMVRWLLR
jgi:hypothetical protein